jgi:non-lysosomal glucosylceramidase
MDGVPYSTDELFSRAGPRAFAHTAREAAFLLGGIGTGNVSVGARGELRDWELWNRPARGQALPFSFFAIRAARAGDTGPAQCRVLESEITAPHTPSHGYDPGTGAGLSRFPGSSLSARYPFVEVRFDRGVFPVEVSLEAFTPFVPLDADDSGIPGAVLRYRVHNVSDSRCRVSVAGSLANFSNIKAREQVRFRSLTFAGTSVNEVREEAGVRGLWLHADGVPADSLSFGSLALLAGQGAAGAGAPGTGARGASGAGGLRITAKRQWLCGGWWDGFRDFWDDFTADGELSLESVYKARAPQTEKDPRVSSLCQSAELAADEERTFTFILAWSFPNRVSHWNEDAPVGPPPAGRPVVRNWYARRFPDAWTAGSYLVSNLPRLETLSREFTDAFYGGTLPAVVVDAAASNITVLRSTSCFRLETGEFLSYEGCFDESGCCDGNCTHVWNYAQTLAFLFPELERSMRRIEFGLETDQQGKMTFRTYKVFGLPQWQMHPAVDGQLGTLVRLYRDWKVSGDTAFLRELWPAAARSLDFAFTQWDSDGDGLLDSEQHNTYDIEFHGPNSLANSMFCAALKAGSEMAAAMGDAERSGRWAAAARTCSRLMDERLWNGSYYEQRLDDVDEHKYQYGTGCLSDQVFGQFLAHVAGLGHVITAARSREAAASIYRHNFKASLRDHECVQRTYALNDESGLVLCTWPRGGRPLLPFVYSDEVWTGIEYQVASHLIMEGLVPEGLSLVKAVRDRHDGIRRNPWDEVECGHHYVRSMASWALVIAMSGFTCDMTSGRVSFAPAVPGEFRSFFSTGKCWGIYARTADPATGKLVERIEVKRGDAQGIRLAPGP